MRSLYERWRALCACVLLHHVLTQVMQNDTRSALERLALLEPHLHDRELANILAIKGDLLSYTRDFPVCHCTDEVCSDPLTVCPRVRLMLIRKRWSLTRMM
jgi:hypothetical protein